MFKEIDNLNKDIESVDVESLEKIDKNEIEESKALLEEMNAKMQISEEKWHELSSIVLGMVRDIDEILGEKGWQGWTTSGMRMMTDSILYEIFSNLGIEIEKDDFFTKKDK